MADTSQAFRRELLKIGIISYSDQDTLWSIAKRCAATTGVPMAGSGLILGLNAGTVTIPGVGTMSGALAGLLAGLFAGTAICTAANLTYRDQLRRLLDEQ